MTMSPKLKLRKTARIRNLATGAYLERFDFQTSSGEAAQIELPPSVANDQRLFAQRLRDAGAILPIDKSKRTTLLSAAAAGQPCEQERVLAAQGGWTAGETAFVRPEKIIGGSSLNIIGFHRSKPSDPRGLIKRNGTSASWKAIVAAPATRSSILMFSISAAFAAVILKAAGRNSFGVCLFGPSRSGKTLATVVAGSVAGTGSTSQLLDWNATDARIQEQLPELNDCLAPVDDLMTMVGSDKKKYGRIHWISHILALGVGSGRHSSFQEAATNSWRTIVLSSNEISIRDLAAKSGLERNPGETVRFIDLPATFGGAADIFDLKHQNDEGMSWEQWFKVCEANQGLVIESFVDAVIAQGPDIHGLIRDYIKSFVASVSDRSDGNLARDVADKFGAVCAAGELAILFNLVPWKRVKLRKAIRKCYFAARELLPDDGVTFRSGKQALIELIHSLPRKTNIDTEDNSSLVGFYEQSPGNKRYLIKREKFNSIFATDAQSRMVMKWLTAEGRITLAKTAAGPKKIKEQHIWPDGKRYRSVELLWPRQVKNRRPNLINGGRRA